MFNIVLFEPEIPPNTGNIIRLAANTGCQLHLIEPLGFDLEEKKLRRAGLDYREFTTLILYSCWEDFIAKNINANIFPISTKGKFFYSEMKFTKDDYFLFGPETRGLPKNILDNYATEKILRIPMTPDSRSLNLSNSVSIIVFEAWRQLGYVDSV